MSTVSVSSRASLLLLLVASAGSVVACGSAAETGNDEASDLDTANVQADKTLASRLVGTWIPATAADATAATFTSLTLQSNDIWYESGQGFDGTISAGVYSLPSSIPVGADFGAPPAGMTGPYLQVTDNSKGDGQWDYGSLKVSTSGTSLTMTLYAQREGMGLRWAQPTVLHLVKHNASLPPLGTWKPATTTDRTNAGFATVTIGGGGAWSETGRTDGDTDSQGMYSEPLTVPITDPDFGSPPAGMHGPYLQLAETGDGDGDWIYGFSEAADGSELTLNLYARSLGMGLRWANPAVTIKLVPSK
jgi:hypothetical protein